MSLRTNLAGQITCVLAAEWRDSSFPTLMQGCSSVADPIRLWRAERFQICWTLKPVPPIIAPDVIVDRSSRARISAFPEYVISLLAARGLLRCGASAQRFLHYLRLIKNTARNS